MSKLEETAKLMGAVGTIITCLFALAILGGCVALFWPG